MATNHTIDRRRHHGPLRFMYMDFSTFLQRFFGLSPRRFSKHRR